MRTVVLTRLDCVVIKQRAHKCSLLCSYWQRLKRGIAEGNQNAYQIFQINVLLIELSFYEALEDMEIYMPLKCPLESLSIYSGIFT